MSTPPPARHRVFMIGIWLGIGVGVGAAVGVAAGAIAQGVALGAALGVALGYHLSKRASRQAPRGPSGPAPFRWTVYRLSFLDFVFMQFLRQAQSAAEGGRSSCSLDLLADELVHS